MSRSTRSVQRAPRRRIRNKVRIEFLQSTGCVERSFLDMLAVDSRMHFASELRSLAAGNGRTRIAMSFITGQEN